MRRRLIAKPFGTRVAMRREKGHYSGKQSKTLSALRSPVAPGLRWNALVR